MNQCRTITNRVIFCALSQVSYTSVKLKSTGLYIKFFLSIFIFFCFFYFFIFNAISFEAALVAVAIVSVCVCVCMSVYSPRWNEKRWSIIFSCLFSQEYLKSVRTTSSFRLPLALITSIHLLFVFCRVRRAQPPLQPTGSIYLLFLAIFIFRYLSYLFSKCNIRISTRYLLKWCTRHST